MDNLFSNSELENLIREISQGREMTTQLQNHLNVSSSSSRDKCDYLLHKILYSYDQALSIIRNNRRASDETLTPSILMATNQDSPQSLVSDESDQDFKDLASKKRKAVAKWTKKVKVSPERGIEGQLDDGFYWRKYGQKDILGAKHPRGYYRCSHRHAQGCLATKQVQKSDEDPITYEITYRRKHTCNTRVGQTNVNNPPISLPGPQNIDPTPLPQNSQEPSFNIQTSLGFVTQDLGSHTENPFINPEINNIFSDCEDILGNYSFNILSPSTFGSNIFPNPTHVTNYDCFDNLESQLSPFVAGISSTTTPPTVSTHSSFGFSEFGSGFSFNNQGYFW
ncbi:WRKY Transcription Factor [Castilleja foliolosa]|uniref:WRKY Transcription Factor n=1 Tax=Castilleja foliolosa TaxID=1961234 RepID=A0ABD3EGQ6_9LAMI